MFWSGDDENTWTDGYEQYERQVPGPETKQVLTWPRNDPGMLPRRGDNLGFFEGQLGAKQAKQRRGRRVVQAEDIMSKVSGERHHCGIGRGVCVCVCVCVCEHGKFHGMGTSVLSSEAERGSISQDSLHHPDTLLLHSRRLFKLSFIEFCFLMALCLNISLCLAR